MDEGNVKDDEDIDGIPLESLEARFEKRVAVNQWCTCEKCNDSLLMGAREYRCYSEVPAAIGKLVIETIKCVTQHEDYKAMTQKIVLTHVGPLLKDKNGRSYKQRAGQTKNQYLRAVAYRWTIRYLFGYLGWDNTGPLPACVYHDIRTRFPSAHSTGYASAQERE